MKQFPRLNFDKDLYTLPKMEICQPFHTTPYRYLPMHHDQINPHTYHQSATIPSNYPESLNLLWARRVIWFGIAICCPVLLPQLQEPKFGRSTPHPCTAVK
ncbi:uncharacterized protein K444DRAFT_431562 [Hyaloscypha bicolor E]|uniref:Uncharacterized protein n=1 Tax=Hyaloscypha bicolor E TaxID=1095630 RepID=A0A2J6T5T7_9HELO|nr:uncharacterized protein K444DRAFT_431562 [Hyaloscypha bicolor E]PMD58382.1 hypothetical protein K444DRAFT_431562 [Hyaloscypha bicolor E]